MNHRSFLPAVKPNGRPPAVAPMAARLQDALAKIMTEAEIEDLLRSMLADAKTGSAIEKRAARQILLGLLGARAQTQPQYVQQNFYSAKAKQQTARDTLALVVRFLEAEGPAKPETIAAEVVRSRREVAGALDAHPELFERTAADGGAWSLRANR